MLLKCPGAQGPDTYTVKVLSTRKKEELKRLRKSTLRFFNEQCKAYYEVNVFTNLMASEFNNYVGHGANKGNIVAVLYEGMSTPGEPICNKIRGFDYGAVCKVDNKYYIFAINITIQMSCTREVLVLDGSIRKLICQWHRTNPSMANEKLTCVFFQFAFPYYLAATLPLVLNEQDAR